MNKTLIAAFVASFGIAGIAAAQDAATPPAAPSLEDTYVSARNQLGVLEYCQAAGFVEAEAIEVQNRMLGMIPVPDDTSAADAAYAKGKEGTVSAMGVERSLSDAATEQGTTEDALCKQMDALLQQLATQVPA